METFAAQSRVVRVAIVAESSLTDVNDVSNTVPRILEHLRRTGHEAFVITPDGPDGEPRAPGLHDGVRIHRVPSRVFPAVTPVPLGVHGPGIFRVLRSFAPHVVHLASPAVLGYGGLLAARRLGVPTVAVCQADVSGVAANYGARFAVPVFWAWTRHLHSLADRTLAPSASAVESLRARGVPRVHRWAHGVDFTGFCPSARSEALRAEWSPEGLPIIGLAGCIAPEKQLERLAGLALRRDIQLVIVGDGMDRTRLQSLLPSAVFTGELGGHRLATAYASMDVFIDSGEYETDCQAVQEALASGVPVVAPDAGGSRDLVRPFRTGLLLPPDDFNSGLSRSVDHLLSQRPRYSSAARRSMVDRGWPRICDQLLDHYEEVMAPSPRRIRNVRSA